MAVKKRKKIVDKWKSKKWYEIVAPDMFNNKVIGEAVASDEKSLIDRIIVTNLAELEASGEINRRMFTSTKVKLRIHEVKGKSAYTRYIGHQILPSYLRTLARRGRTVIDLVSDETTKDSKKLRMKIVAITNSNVSYNTKKNLRREMKEAVSEIVKGMDLERLIMDSLQGKVTGKVYGKLKQITKMTKVEIKKLELKESFK